jgi:branched-chain amino acid transport system permease protein
VEIAASIVVNSLVLSSMYIFVALGFALILSMVGILNFAHGAIYMVGGYICYMFAGGLGLNQWLSLLMSVLIVGIFGLFLEKFCFRPFSGDVWRVAVMTISLIIILETTVNVTLGAEVRRLPTFVPGVIRTGLISLSLERLVTFAVGGLVLLIFSLFVRKTRTGQQMLAVAQDPEGAALQGISIYQMSALACAIGCGLAAAAGGLMGAILQLSPFMGDYMLLKAIQVVILSGIGSIGGVLVGGLIIGFLDGTLPMFTSGCVIDTVGLGIIVVLLLFRPQGFFGHKA